MIWNQFNEFDDLVKQLDMAVDQWSLQLWKNGGWVFKWRCTPNFNSSLPLNMSFFPKRVECFTSTNWRGGWTTWISVIKMTCYSKMVGYRKLCQLSLTIFSKKLDANTIRHTMWSGPAGMIGGLSWRRLKSQASWVYAGSCDFNWDLGLSLSTQKNFWSFFVKVKFGQVNSGLFSQSLSQNDENCLWTWNLHGKRTNSKTSEGEKKGNWLCSSFECSAQPVIRFVI